MSSERLKFVTLTIFRQIYWVQSNMTHKDAIALVR